jgi:RES domain
VSTMKLVGSLIEQSIQEDLVEATKPAIPRECQASITCSTRRFVMAQTRSRFRRAAHTPGVFYAAEDSRTAALEKAFYRLLFFAESPDTPGPVNPFECTGFSVEVRSPHSLDLTKPPSTPTRKSGVTPSTVVLAKISPTLARCRRGNLALSVGARPRRRRLPRCVDLCRLRGNFP